MVFYVYILLCSNGNYYTGYTTDIERRYQEHLEGSLKCKYTRSFPPTELSAYWEIEGEKADAMRLERAIKKLNREQKERLIASPKLFEELFQDCAY